MDMYGYSCLWSEAKFTIQRYNYLMKFRGTDTPSLDVFSSNFRVGEFFCRVTFTSIYTGENMKKFASPGVAALSRQGGTAQQKPRIPSSGNKLPSEFLDLIRAAHRSQTKRFIRAQRAAEKSAIGVSTLWRDVKRGTFVPPVRISSRNVAWVEAEIDALLAAKALMSRSGKTIDLVEFVAELIKQPE
jgi:predicted DNA-binding transcriptional regulator AlpA